MNATKWMTKMDEKDAILWKRMMLMRGRGRGRGRGGGRRRGGRRGGGGGPHTLLSFPPLLMNKGSVFFLSLILVILLLIKIKLSLPLPPPPPPLPSTLFKLKILDELFYFLSHGFLSFHPSFLSLYIYT